MMLNKLCMLSALRGLSCVAVMSSANRCFSATFLFEEFYIPPDGFYYGDEDDPYVVDAAVYAVAQIEATDDSDRALRLVCRCRHNAD